MQKITIEFLLSFLILSKSKLIRNPFVSEFFSVERKTVDSSQIKSVGYDEATQTLEVEFKSAGASVYQYRGVPPDMADALVRSESVGRFFGQHIRGRFDHERIE